MWREVGAENANFHEFKSDKLLQSYPYWKVDIVYYWTIQIAKFRPVYWRTIQIAKHSDQLESLIFVIVGN